MNSYSKEYIRKVLNNEASENNIMMSLLKLSQMLNEHYEKKAIIIIDEYDIPIQQGYMQGFNDKVNLFMRNLFSG